VDRPFRHTLRRLTAAATKKDKQKGRNPCESLPFLKTSSEELFLLLDGFLGGFLGRGFLLSCHGESPPLQIALVARNRANKYLSLAKE
jgi:hypothetical protein